MQDVPTLDGTLWPLAHAIDAIREQATRATSPIHSRSYERFSVHAVALITRVNRWSG